MVSYMVVVVDNMDKKKMKKMHANLFHETGFSVTIGVNLGVELIHERGLCSVAARVGSVAVCGVVGAAEVVLDVVLALAGEAAGGGAGTVVGELISDGGSCGTVLFLCVIHGFLRGWKQKLIGWMDVCVCVYGR